VNHASYMVLVAPVRLCGFEMYRAWISIGGTITWECFRWSESEASAEARRRVALLERRAA
jgi:hypothetical protein